MDSFASVTELLRAQRPALPVYCVFPEVYRSAARSLVQQFPGRVLYAVKANSHSAVIEALVDGGVRHFDCASLAEIETVKSVFLQARCYFMVPVTLRGATAAAYHQYGVRHFMIDHASGLQRLGKEIPLAECVVFVRMAVSHDAAVMDLSSKFGASSKDVPGLVDLVRHTGAEAAVAFNVGSLVTRTEAYAHALDVAEKVLKQIQPPIRLLDMGGGFPQDYPDYPVPALDAYISTIKTGARSLCLAADAQLMIEPGRALAAPGLSAVVEVLQRRDDRIYLNDGMYGIFWELRFKGHQRYASRAYRNGQEMRGAKRDFRLFGPTCDSSDVLPATVPLPADIDEGDHIEFGRIGAYSLSGRTDFNGLYSDRVVVVNGEHQLPPR